VSDQSLNPSSPSVSDDRAVVTDNRITVNHDRSGLWAPDPLDEFRIERREPMGFAAAEPAVEFVGVLPDARPLAARHANSVAVAPAPRGMASIDRRRLWSFATGSAFGAVCVILASWLTTSEVPRVEPFADDPEPVSLAASQVSSGESEMPPAVERPVLVSNERVDSPVTERVIAPPLTPRSQEARKLTVPSPPVPSPPAQTKRTAFVGSLRIDSTPQGARVFIDRQPAGVTPLVVRDLGVGSHAVRVEADGHMSWSSAIRVISDRLTDVHTPLTPLDSVSVPR
jgi:hypothetical protein